MWWTSLFSRDRKCAGWHLHIFNRSRAWIDFLQATLMLWYFKTFLHFILSSVVRAMKWAEINTSIPTTQCESHKHYSDRCLYGQSLKNTEACLSHVRFWYCLEQGVLSPEPLSDSSMKPQHARVQFMFSAKHFDQKNISLITSSSSRRGHFNRRHCSSQDFITVKVMG